MSIDIIYSAVAEAIFGLLFQKLADHHSTLVADPIPARDSEEERAFHQALESTYNQFKSAYPELAASFFDEHFILQEQVLFELAKTLTPIDKPDTKVLVDIWTNQFYLPPPQDIHRPAKEFVDLLQANVRRHPKLRDAANAQAVASLFVISESATYNTKIQEQILEQLKKIAAEAHRWHVIKATDFGSEEEVPSYTDSPYISLKSALHSYRSFTKLRNDYERIATNFASEIAIFAAIQLKLSRLENLTGQLTTICAANDSSDYQDAQAMVSTMVNSATTVGEEQSMHVQIESQFNPDYEILTPTIVDDIFDDASFVKRVKRAFHPDPKAAIEEQRGGNSEDTRIKFTEAFQRIQDYIEKRNLWGILDELDKNEVALEELSPDSVRIDPRIVARINDDFGSEYWMGKHGELKRSYDAMGILRIDDRTISVDMLYTMLKSASDRYDAQVGFFKHLVNRCEKIAIQDKNTVFDAIMKFVESDYE
ncbi:MAG: hypothetical protein R3A44_35335 [Caldilineaceae bacterium]